MNRHPRNVMCSSLVIKFPRECHRRTNLSSGLRLSLEPCVQTCHKRSTSGSCAQCVDMLHLRTENQESANNPKDLYSRELLWSINYCIKLKTATLFVLLYCIQSKQFLFDLDFRNSPQFSHIIWQKKIPQNLFQVRLPFCNLYKNRPFFLVSIKTCIYFW